MTIEPFAQLHTAGTEDYELVRRELVRWSSATPLHARVRRRVERLVENYFEQFDLTRIPVPFAPGIAVEVLCPHPKRPST
jgi:hypothetical protein